MLRVFAMDEGPGGIVHSNLWPRQMKYYYLLVGIDIVRFDRDAPRT